MLWTLIFCAASLAIHSSYQVQIPGFTPVSFRVGGVLADSSLNLTEVVWIGPETGGLYLGSPAISVVSSGNKNEPSQKLMASHDYFGASTLGATVQVFASQNGGVDWEYANNVTGMYWAEIFEYQGDMYLLGVSGGDSDKNRSIVISRSTQGSAWSTPSILFPANSTHNYHCAPSPLLYTNGMIYRAFETQNPNYAAMLVWAKQGADLLSPSSWFSSSVLSFNESWIQGGSFGFQEGNAVQAPNGDIMNILRLDGQNTKVNNKAVVTRLNPVTSQLEFHSVIDFPACSSKFTVRRASSGRYYTISTNVTDQNIALNLIYARNNLVFAVSDDFYRWRVCSTLLRDDTGFAPVDSARFTGFHYVSWVFDGDDIIYVVRTGYRGANSYHNANRMTFKRIVNFAQLC